MSCPWLVSSLRSCLVAWPLLVLASMPTRVNADESAEDRFLDEAPRQWLEYRKIIARHTEIVVEETIRDLVTEHVEQHQLYFTIALARDRVLSNGLVVSRDRSYRRVSVYNPHCRFLVTGGDDNEWVLKEFRNHGSWSPPDDLIGGSDRDRLSFLMGEDGPLVSSLGWACLGQRLRSAWVSRMVSAPDLTLLHADYVEDDRRLVKVQFEFEPEMPLSGGLPCRSGMMVLDPSRYWQIREAQTATYAWGGRGRGTLRLENEFNDTKLPVPFVSRQVIRTSYPPGENLPKEEFERTYVVDMTDVPNVDTGKFTLAAFGLPEPAEAQAVGRTRIWVFMTSAVLLLAVLLLVVRRWSHREASHTQ